MEKLAPQLHPCSAKGLLIILNAERINSVWYSTVAPFIYSKDVESIITLAPSFWNIL